MLPLSAEKIIKAIIIEKGSQGGIPRSHDLSFLMNQIKNQVVIEEKFYDYADELTPYGIAVRYPNELFLGQKAGILGNSITEMKA